MGHGSSHLPDHLDETSRSPVFLTNGNRPPPQPGKLFSDWSRTLQFTFRNVYKPTIPEEIKDILNKCEQVSVIGSAHSSSRVWFTEDIITLDSMPKEFHDASEEGQPAYSTVKFSANFTLRECMQLLAEEGRTLPATGGVDEQQLGGLLGTNTAPASKEYTIYSDMKEIEYVTKDDAHKKATGEDLKAMIPNLGLVGVVTYITIGTIPNYGMRAIQRILPMKDLVNLLEDGGNYISGDPMDKKDGKDLPFQFWRMDIIPQLKTVDLNVPGTALLWAARKIEGENDPAWEQWLEHPDGDYVDSDNTMPLSMRTFCTIQKMKHSLNPYNDPSIATIFKVQEMLIKDTPPQTNTWYGPQRNMLPVDRYMNEKIYCAMAEWAFLPKDVKTVLDIYQEYFHSNEWPNLPIEVEYVKCDDYYMSPWNSNKMDGGPVEYLVKANIMWFFSQDYTDPHDGKQKKRSYKEIEIIRYQMEVHAEGLWDKLKKEGICFKAHWGKINFTSPEDVEQLYEWDKFKKYIQPEMMNKHYERILPEHNGSTSSS